MKTLIITTKQKDNCYNRIRDAWFASGKSFRVTPNPMNLARPDLQFVINKIRVVENDEYRLCLPTWVNDASLDDRVEYVLSLVCAISELFHISKDDLYVLFHSGDLFDTQDANRTTGPLYFEQLYATPERLELFEKVVKEEHLFQFRHDSNITNILFKSSGGDISTLCSAIIDRIEKR